MHKFDLMIDAIWLATCYHRTIGSTQKKEKKFERFAQRSSELLSFSSESKPVTQMAFDVESASNGSKQLLQFLFIAYPVFHLVSMFVEKDLFRHAPPDKAKKRLK